MIPSNCVDNELSNEAVIKKSFLILNKNGENQQQYESIMQRTITKVSRLSRETVIQQEN